MRLSLRDCVVLLACIGIAACSGPPVQPRFDNRSSGVRTPEITPTQDEIDTRVAAVIRLHNEERAKQKLPSLEPNPRLQKAASRHALDMANRKKMTHIGLDGTSPMDRIKEAGYRYQRAGENVAYGRFTSERLMAGWMDSLPHKRNILGSFSQIGASCAIAADGTSYWCVTFGLPLRP